MPANSYNWDIGPSPLMEKHRTNKDNPVPEAGIPLPFGLFFHGQDVFVSVFKSILGAARGKAMC